MSRPSQNKGSIHEQQRGWLKGLILVPIPALILLIIFFVYNNPGTVFEPPYLLPTLNVLFLAVVPFTIAYLVWRGYADSGQISLFFIGCAMIAFGFSSLIAGFLIDLPGGTNLTPTVHNTGALLGAALLVTAAVLSLQKAPQYKLAGHRRLYLGSSYLVIIILISLFAFAAYRGVVPLYFVQGTGPTILRQCVLGAAAFLFAVSAVIFFVVYRRSHAAFTYWFSIALILIAIGLSAIFFQKTVGGPIGWTGRVAQYLGCAYLLVGIVASYRMSGINNVPLKIELARSFNYVQANYQMLVELASDAIISVDKKGSILTWNPAAAGMFGYSVSEAAGISIINLIFPGETASLLNLELTKLSGKVAMAEGIGNKLEIKARRKDGVSFPVEVSAASKYVAGEQLSIFIVRDITERKQIEANLEHAHNILIAAQKIAHLGSFQYIEATATTSWSEEEYRIYDLDPTGPSPAYDVMLKKCIHPDDAALLHETFTKAMQSRSIYELEHRIVRPDGSVRWVYDRANPYFDDKGNLVRYVGTTLDITERKLVEEAARQSEERFRVLFENAPISIWEEDFSRLKAYFDHLRADGITDCRAYFDAHEDQVGYCAGLIEVIDVNQTSIRFFEVDHKAQIPSNLPVFFTSESLPVFKEELVALAEGRTNFECEIPIRTLTGGSKVLFLSLSVVPGCEQTLSRVLVSFIDISERKRAEESLRDSEHRIRSYFEMPIIGIAITSPEKGWLEVNPALCSMLGYSYQELSGLTWSELTHPADLEADVAQFRRLTVGEIETYAMEKRFIRKDGSIVWTNLSVSCVRKSDGSLQYAIAILQDISDRKQVEQALMDSESQFRLLFNAVPVGIGIGNLEGEVIANNMRMQEITGYSLEDYKTVKLADVYANPEDREKMLRILGETGH